MRRWAWPAMTALLFGHAPVLAGGVSGDGVRQDPSATARCPNGPVQATPIDRQGQLLKQAHVTTSEPRRLVSAATIRTCGAAVTSVWSGGVLIGPGDGYEIGPGVTRDVGRFPHGPGPEKGVPCPTGTEIPGRAIKCIGIVGVSGGYIVLSTFGARTTISVVGRGKTSEALTVTGRGWFVDIAYLPAPDAPGGNIFAYVRTSRNEGLFLISRSAL